MKSKYTYVNVNYLIVFVLTSWWEVRSIIDIRQLQLDYKFSNHTSGRITKAPIDTSKQPIVWILGGPGAGKGTQCEKIVAKYGFVHLSSGDLLRQEVKKGTDRSKCLSGAMQRGELVPNDIVLDLLKEAMEANDHAKGFLIDGYPREKFQGIAFENVVAPVTVIIYFEVPEEIMFERLLGRAAVSGRADDNEETIKLRLKTFLEHNDLVLAEYPDKLKTIDATKTVDEIFKEVESILDAIVIA